MNNMMEEFTTKSFREFFKETPHLVKALEKAYLCNTLLYGRHTELTILSKQYPVHYTISKLPSLSEPQTTLLGGEKKQIASGSFPSPSGASISRGNCIVLWLEDLSNDLRRMHEVMGR